MESFVPQFHIELGSKVSLRGEDLQTHATEGTMEVSGKEKEELLCKSEEWSDV